MKRLPAALLLAATVSWAAGPAQAAPQVGAPAPAFTAVDSMGKTHDLSAYKGKTVVLEWTNHECPYTVKHYESGNMQGLQAKARDAGVVWLSVISSAPGRQGHVTAAEANDLTTARQAAPAAVLLDPEGKVGHLYDARTTPHMFVIDPAGKLTYMGAIDDRPTARLADVPGARNHVAMALAEMAGGKPVSVPVTRPYGCSVKYAW
ncbi:MAG: redoxin domain-containing protein [Hyphomicrobiales bacterium]|nr:redoxin domain-containing protein [Hyphomicrobiales bacterium]MCP5371771.1 redoxin domain-containing protein [Hyphomicrobiales bacterium]